MCVKLASEKYSLSCYLNSGVPALATTGILTCLPSTGGTPLIFCIFEAKVETWDIFMTELKSNLCQTMHLRFLFISFISYTVPMLIWSKAESESVCTAHQSTLHIAVDQ